MNFDSQHLNGFFHLLFIFSPVTILVNTSPWKINFQFMPNLVKYIKYNNLRSSRVFCPKFSLVLRCLSTHFGKWRHDRDSACRSLLLELPSAQLHFFTRSFSCLFFLSFVWADAWRFSVKDPTDVWPCFPTKTTHVHTCYNNNFSFTTNPSEGQTSTKTTMKAKMLCNNHESESPGELDTDVFLRINLHVGNLQRQIQYSHTEYRRWAPVQPDFKRVGVM